MKKEFKTVKDILEIGKLKLTEKTTCQWKTDKKGKGYWKHEGTGVFTINESFAKEGELLARNIDKPLLFAYASGPVVMFAFKIRGSYAMFKLNAVQNSNFSSRTIERTYDMKSFMDYVARLRKCKKYDIDIATPDFDTAIVLEACK